MFTEARSTKLARTGSPELVDHLAVLSWPFIVPLDSQLFDPPFFLNHLLPSLTSSPSWPRWSLAQGDNEGKRGAYQLQSGGVVSFYSPAAMWAGGPGLS